MGSADPKPSGPVRHGLFLCFIYFSSSPKQLGLTFLNHPYFILFEERNVKKVWSELVNRVVLAVCQGAIPGSFLLF